jgi:hypothetical protein
VFLRPAFIAETLFPVEEKSPDLWEKHPIPLKGKHLHAGNRKAISYENNQNIASQQTRGHPALLESAAPQP